MSSNDSHQEPEVNRLNSQPQSFAIIPAAGRSSRMGQAKLLMPWGTKLLIEHVIDVWRASKVARVIVVVAPDDARLADVCRSSQVDVVVPAHRPPEMKDSVAAGLQYVARRYEPAQRDVWLLAPADIPALSTRIINQLLSEHDVDSPTILVPIIGTRRAHPVLFPWPMAEQVDALAAGEGVNVIINAHPPRTVAWNDAALLSDIDTMEDYNRLQNRQSPNG